MIVRHHVPVIWAIIFFVCSTTATTSTSAFDNEISSTRISAAATISTSTTADMVVAENRNDSTTPSVYPQPVRYFEPVVDDEYRSTDTFDPMGMQPVYVFANTFLDMVQSENLPKAGALPGATQLKSFLDGMEEIIIVDLFSSNMTLDNVVQVMYDKKQELVLHSTGMVVTASVGLLIAVIVTITGFLFCVCRVCAGKCGARPSPYEKHYDGCRRFCYGFLLSVLVVLILYGVVCAFMTNEYMQTKIRELPDTLDSSVDDVGLYLNNTKSEVNTMLVTNYQQLEGTLEAILNRCGDIIKLHLAEVSRALAVENLTSIVSGLEAVREDLNGIVENTQRLQLSARQLENALNLTRNRLQFLLSTCTEDLCLRVAAAYDLKNLRVRSDFGKLPDVTETAREISRLVRDDIENEVRKGKESLDSVGQQIQGAVNSTIPDIKRIVRDVGLDLERNSAKIARNIDDEIELKHMRGNIQATRSYIKAYAPIWYYSLLGVCCVILFINTLLTFGLFCGFCGPKPNYVYGDESCTKGTGARFLIISIYLVILFYFALMVTTTGLFLMGGIAKKAVCDPIVKSPNSSEIFRLADVAVKAYDTYPQGRRHNRLMSDALERCHGNQSIYRVLHLESDVNIDAVTNYKQRFRVREKIQEFADKISISPSLVILTPQARSQLQQLADSKLSEINFTKYSQLLDNEILDTNLTSLMTALSFLSRKLEDSRPDISNELTNEIVFLKGMENMILSAIHLSMSQLKINVHRLEENIRFNRSSFKDWVQDLLTQAEKAQDFIQNQGRSEVVNLAQKLANNFTSYLDDYANMVNTHVKEEIGKCWPVSKAVNASIVAVCKSILEPLNGFWVSTGWCLTFFIPIILLAVHLSKLYQKTDLHSLPSTESDCFSDNFLYRDTFPLANHADKKRRRKNQVTYDNQNGYAHVDRNPEFASANASASSVGGTRIPAATTSGSPSRRGGYLAAATYDYGSGAEGYELDDPHTFRNIPVKPSSSTTSDWDNLMQADEAPPRYSSATNLTAQDFERPPPYYYPGPGAPAAK